MWLRDSLHRQQVMGGIEKNKWSDPAGRGDGREGLHAQCLAFDSTGITAPIGGDTQARQRLFKNPRFSVGSFEQHSAVRYAAGQVGEDRRFVRRDAGGGAEVLK